MIPGGPWTDRQLETLVDAADAGADLQRVNL
jgi:hypothetical protein